MLDVLPACVSGNWVTPVALLGLTVLLTYLYGTWTFSTWSQVGIPGPKPVPFLGNVREFQTSSRHKATLEWTKKYGKTFGIYLMRTPVLLTTDVDILKEVFIKDFNNFTDRPIDNPLTPDFIAKSLAAVKDQQWKRQRHTMTPTFSASKLKLMGPFISRCCQNLVKSVERTTAAGRLLDVKQVFGSFTLDVIAGTAFGFETNSLADDGNQFLANAKEVFGNANNFGMAPAVAAACRPLGHVMKKLGFSTTPEKEMNFVVDTIKTIMGQRRHGNQKSQDLLQLLLDAEATEAFVASHPGQKHLTNDEIVAQGLVFFVAGYETTATTLQYLSYLLALNPEKQDKLYQEIVDAIGDADPKYENVMPISYLDSCIHEALRLFPPVAFVGRVAREERTIKGVTIPAGTLPTANIIGLMRDEQFFPRPQEFLPARFEDKERPVPPLVREMMFGAGPRQCIGMRLALYEAKMAMVSLVRKFRFVKVKATPDEITMAPRGLGAPTVPIFVGTERR